MTDALIACIYWMNFVFIPGLHSAYGFWGSIIGMILLSAILVMFFRWRKWL
jgi:magnesium transporter